MVTNIAPEASVWLLFAAFGLMLAQAWGGQINWGRFRIYPGWLGLSIWAFLAAWRAAVELGISFGG